MSRSGHLGSFSGCYDEEKYGGTRCHLHDFDDRAVAFRSRGRGSTRDLLEFRSREQGVQDELEEVIKGKYNLLTSQSDFESQVIIAQEFICAGTSDDIDLQSISRALTYQIKKS